MLWLLYGIASVFFREKLGKNTSVSFCEKKLKINTKMFKSVVMVNGVVYALTNVLDISHFIYMKIIY